MFLNSQRRNSVWIAILLGCIVVQQLFVMANQSPKDSNHLYKEESRRYYRVFSPIVPDTMTFLGETVPLQKYWVREALDRELTANMFQHFSTFLVLKRATRYFPLIEPILKKNNLPDDLKYLCVAESALSNAVSPAQAEGFWQFLKKTAKEYQLEVTDDIDERYHLEKATEAACRYLRKGYEYFGSWSLSCAAYNLGTQGLSRRLEAQQVNDYWTLHLPHETARYVYRIMAIKIILENPEEYGFYLREQDCYPPLPTRTIQIDTSIQNLYDFAQEQDIPYRLFRQYNPWLRSTKLSNPKQKTYVIQLPLNDDFSWEGLHRGFYEEESHPQKN